MAKTIQNMQELIKLIHGSAEFYLGTFLKIRTKEGTLEKFKLNPAQRNSLLKIIEAKRLNKPIRVIWLKARQLGISTLCEGLIFHDTANNSFKNSLIIAHEDRATQNLFNMSKLFHEELPSMVRPMKKYSNESALTFENPTNNDEEKYGNPGLRSKITVATAKNVKSSRSNTIHNLHASEVAFWDNAETLMTGLLQCIPNTPNTMIFLESTANGVGGWFYNFWKSAVAGENEYIPIFLAWFDNPEYTMDFLSEDAKQSFLASVKDDIEVQNLINVYNITPEQLNWRRWCISNNCNGNLETFHQEYPSTPDEAFIVSGRPVFPVTQLMEYQAKCTKPIKSGYLKTTNDIPFFFDEPKGYIDIWRMPEYDKYYVIGGDVAEGLSIGDYSVGVVLDEDFNLCAMWHGHIDPDMFGDELVKLAQFYNEAYMAPEINNHGFTTLKSILRHEYWNLYYQKTYNKINDTVSKKPGWTTNKRTKPMMIDRLCEFIREGWLSLPSSKIVSEMFTYVKADDGTTNSQTGSHDDTIMATAIALQLLLDGKSDNYEPESPNDIKKKYKDDDQDYIYDVDKEEEVEYTI